MQNADGLFALANIGLRQTLKGNERQDNGLKRGATESESRHGLTIWRARLAKQTYCAEQRGRHSLGSTIFIRPLSGRLSKPKKRQDEQDDDDQTDEVNDAVHLISPKRG